MSGFRSRINIYTSLVLACSLASSVQAASPRKFRIEASLFSADGAPETSARDIQIKLFTAASGGSAVWTSPVYQVTPQSGRVTLLVDGDTGTPSSLATIVSSTDFASAGAYFEIVVDTGTANGTMNSPVATGTRIQARSTPFALAASVADSLAGVTATVAEMNRLAGLTANVQAQLNALGGSGSGVSKTGDTMSGTLDVGADVNAQNVSVSGVYKIGTDRVLHATNSNVFLGVGAGSITSTAYSNTFLGANTGTAITDGSANTVVGANAGYSLLTGGSNSFFGDSSGYNMTDGTMNTGYGASSLYSHILGNGNTAIGTGALYTLSAGDRNTALGASAGQALSTGVNNIFIGETAGTNVNLGDDNIYLGRTGGTDGDENIVIGNGSDVNSGSDGNIALGHGTDFRGDDNILIGTGVHSGNNINSVIAIGMGAGAAANSAVQVGAGNNTTPDSFQFYDWNFLNRDGDANFHSLNGISASVIDYLSGVTGDIQTQLNASGGSGKVDRSADTMTGDLGLAGAAVPNTNRALYIDASRKVASATTTLTELNYLSGVTTNLGTKLNPVSTTELGYLVGTTSSISGRLNGLTAAVQTQINLKVDRSADTMTGDLGLAGAAVPNTNRALYIDASRKIASATTTTTELNYLSGVTGSIQTQLQRYWGSSCSTGYYMSGIDVSGNIVCTALPSNVAVSQITMGGAHSCALLSDNTVMCVGANAFGQLGIGSTTGATVPGYVRELDGSKTSSVTSIDAGGRHSCVVKVDGTLWCWGYNGVGQLGVGNTTSPYAYPVQVSGITGAVQVSAGGDSTCVRITGGVVKCWGSNGYGQLGDATQTDRNTPVAVSGLTNAVWISSGGHSSCAVLTDGTAKCWGYNGTYPLGDGTTTLRTTPVAVSGLSGATAITVSSEGATYGGAACALKGNGIPYCWGLNSNGQLGVGDTLNRSTPTQVSGISNAIKIANGIFSACAVLSDGTAKCWGYNGSGNLGDGTATGRNTPVAVVGVNGTGTLSGVTQIDVADRTIYGYYFSGAVSSGRWYSWGDNSQATFGNGNTTNSNSARGAQAP